MRIVLVMLLSFFVMASNLMAYDVYADKNELTAQQVLTLDDFKFADVWKSFGSTKDTYWILLEDLDIVTNDQFWMFIENSALDHIEVYKVNEDGQPDLVYHVGDTLPFDQRPIIHRAFLLPFKLKTTDRLLVKVWGATPLAIDFKLGDSNKVFAEITKNENILKVVFGIMLALLIYNLILFLVTRLAEYFWYVVYMGGIISFVVFINGMGFQYFWPNSPSTQNSIAFLFICIFQFGAFGFTRQFLNLKEVSKIFDRFYQIASLLPLLMLIAIFVHKGFALKIVSFTTLLLFIIVPAAIILTAIRKSKSALIFLVSWMFMVIGMLVLNLTLNSRLNLTFINIHALEFGVALESILLSFALAFRIRNKQERSKIHLQIAYKQIENTLLTVEKSNHAKDSFLASVSHQLKTPLHSLIGSVQLLNLSVDQTNPKTMHLLKTTDVAASKLFQNIDKLLVFSEFIAGDAKMINSTVNLKEEIEASQKHWSLMNSSELTTFRLNIESTLPKSVKTDWVHCNKILSFALENAFSDNLSNVVLLNVKHSEHSVSFVITGNGKLNDVSLLQWLNADELPETWSELGFGFYLCQKMADLIGATIEFKQNENDWQFSLDNPIKIKAVNLSDENTSFQGKRILVVDDISVNLKIMQALIKSLGAQAIVVNSGEKAIELLQTQHFDLVLMDCQMPMLSGQETTLKIRQSGSIFCNIPIIAVTANTQDQDRLSCKQAGMNDFIAKPIRLPTLLISLKKWI
ncbi:MAG: response regulator [Saccharospirillaceae bacterium]|nr:response regulator [Pseudomonadales bacterium]NRB78580.1 response regulator [Saccharospirillaceae bacterium]